MIPLAKNSFQNDAKAEHQGSGQLSHLRYSFFRPCHPWPGDIITDCKQKAGWEVDQSGYKLALIWMIALASGGLAH